MNLYLSKAHSDEDGPNTDEGKLAIIYSSKEELEKICVFFQNVKNHLNSSDTCHMHLRDSFDGWDRVNHVDIEVNVK